MGFTNVSIMASCYEFAVELAYPVGEAMSSGFINFVSMGFSFGVSYWMSLLVKDDVD